MRVEKGGTLKTVEVECVVAVVRRLAVHAEVADRRGVARGPVGGNRHGRRQRAASPPVHSSEQPIVIEPSAELRLAVERARASVEFQAVSVT